MFLLLCLTGSRRAGLLRVRVERALVPRCRPAGECPACTRSAIVKEVGTDHHRHRYCVIVAREVVVQVSEGVGHTRFVLPPITGLTSHYTLPISNTLPISTPLPPPNTDLLHLQL